MAQAEHSTGRSRSPMMLATLVVALVATVALYALVPVSAAPWITAAHLFFVIAWMAGMLYLPRLFVYHTENAADAGQAATFTTMERRLLKGIMTPAMIATWIFGLWLAIYVFGMQGAWLHAKIALVVLLSGLHGFLSASSKKLARGEFARPARFWRIVNEVPAVVLAIILVLVIVKPF